MSRTFKHLLASYDYPVNPKLIAQVPPRPRDSARLLVYNRASGQVHHDRFTNLHKYLPPRAVLVFNQTKVLPARLAVQKPSGGQVKLLYLGSRGKQVEVLAEKRLEQGSELTLQGRYHFTVTRVAGNHYWLKPKFASPAFLSLLARYGETPLPPYLKHSPLSEARRRAEYQTIFAKQSGSVAAPTAALHFTKRLLQKLKAGGFGVEFVTLHVSLGTFAPLTESQVRRGKLHAEYYEVSQSTARALTQAKAQGRPIIAVGTTVVRTLESAATPQGHLTKRTGATQLFISPGYRFKFISGLITNFHVPRSSLLMLVAALTTRLKLLKLYALAQRHKYRLFSFGDGMLIT